MSDERPVPGDATAIARDEASVDAAPTAVDAVGARPTSASRAGIGTGLLLALALLSSFSPVATDLYLPGFPQMAADLGTNASGAQLTLTTFLVGLAVGQLVMGPLSDRFGRRAPLLVSTCACIAAGVLAAVAPSLPVLVAARLVQGLTGAGGLVIGRAVIADLTSGRDAAKALTLMMTVGGVAPIVAPIAGSLLAEPVGWRGMLWATAALCVLMLVAIVVAVPESLPRERRGQASIPFGRALRQVLGNRGYRTNAAVFVLVFSVLMGYISASPFVYQDIIGLGEVGYGAAFAVNAAGMVAVGWTSTRLLDRFQPRAVVRTALIAIFSAAAAFLVLALSGAPAWTYALALFALVLPMGAAIGTSAGLAMSEVRQAAGTGSALMGGMQFGVGAIVSPLVGLGGAESALVPAAVLATCAALALITALRAGRTGSVT